jgi:two-component system LytT family sensor kinase
MAIRRLFNSHQSWLIIAAVSIIPATLSSVATYVNSRVAGRPNWGDVIVVAGLWLIFGPLTWIPYTMARRFPLRRERIIRWLLPHVGGALVMSLIWTFLGVLLLFFVRRPPVSFGRYYASSLLTNLSLCVFLYFAALGCLHAFFYYREAREREAREARLAAELSEATLSALRMQLNPHFLFNSLNAITVLVRDQKTEAASRMLELLSGVLRQVLQSEKRQEVTVDDELRFIEKYLAIEQVRFSDRLEIVWSVDDAVRDAVVPEFILQPLVENAIRHGISKRSEQGLIEITATIADDNVLLIVRDNGPGYNEDVEGGIGLENTRNRVHTLFGDRAHFEVRNLNGRGTVATLKIPLRRRGSG